MEEKPVKRGRPRKVPDNRVRRTLHIMVGDGLFAWLNQEKRRRGLATRADAVRAIFEEARSQG